MLKKLVAPLCVWIALGGAALAQDAPKITQNPDWARRPTPSQQAAAWPKNAKRHSVQGVAILECQAGADGALAGCRSVEEAPTGSGFGDAALSLMPGYQLKAQATPGTVRFPIRFLLLQKVVDRPLSNSTRVSTGPVFPTTGPPMKANWVAAPTRAQVLQAYPAGSPAAYASLDCHLQPTGEIAKCEPAAEGELAPQLKAAVDRLVPLFKADVGALDPARLKASTVRLDIYFPNQTAGWTRVDTQPEWAGSFSADQSAELYPPQAAEAGVKTGRAVLDCTSDTAGRLTSCKVIGENPSGMAFGAAAIRLAPLMTLRRWTEDGLPIEGTEVMFAVRLNLAEGAGAPAAKP